MSGKRDMAKNQAVKMVISRELWAEFRENCEDNKQKPLATLRDWMNQYNDHCEEQHETPSN